MFESISNLFDIPPRNFDERKVRKFLQGRKFMAPSLSNQRLWARTLAPDLCFDETAGSWRLLTEFTGPLILKHASQAHCRGVERLGLLNPERPSVIEFEARVLKETGWRISWCEGEVPAADFFALLARRTFPCVPDLRPVSEVFCGSKPDFWHEAVGHVAALVAPEVSRFYQASAEIVCQTLESGNSHRATQLMEILWVLLEYGLIRETDGRLVTFGAALTGSFMALKRWERGYIVGDDLDPAEILKSGLYEDGKRPKRDAQGRLAFFIIPDLRAAEAQLRRFVAS